jgi:hypothetical protein
LFFIKTEKKVEGMRNSNIGASKRQRKQPQAFLQASGYSLGGYLEGCGTDPPLFFPGLLAWKEGRYRRRYYAAARGGPANGVL